ncbi:MAG: porin family protein [Imperialibacter sp.]|uniref:porin family protein n=1 Tax=Imperialibacter sp. TaxID=2038411 RepID=UPI0032ED1D10
MKNLYLILFLFAFLANHNLLSQDFNSVSGYIVKVTGDTINGSIKRRSDLNEQVSFRASGSQQYTDLTPNELRSYYFDGGYFYETMTIPSLGKRFALRLFNGEISLFQIEEKLFVIKNGGEELLELLHEEDKKQDFKLIEDKRYVRTLLFLTSDCPSVKGKIENVSYNASNISKVLAAYQTCIAPNSQKSDKDISKTKLFFGVRAGAAINRLTYFVDSKNNLYYDHRFDSKIGFLIGPFLNMVLTDKLSVQTEIILATKASYLSDVLFVYSGQPWYDETNVAVSYIELPISFKYTLPTQNIKPYILAGGSFGFKVADSSTRIYHEIEREVEISQDMLGLQFGVGLSKNLDSGRKIDFGYRFCPTLINRSYFDYKARWITQQIGVSYSFSTNN